MYATGEGQTIPPGEDGKLAEPPFPEPVLPVEVIIGDLPAKVLDFGAAPGFAGLVQANIEIPLGLQAAPLTPEGVRLTNAAPMTATVSRISTQDGATIAVDDGAGAGENQLPPADGQSVITDEDTPLGITLTGSDPDDDTLALSIVSG